MAEYKSEVKKIYFPIERVYAKLSDLSNLAVIQQNLDNPALRETILSQAEGKVTSEQLDQIVERLRTLEFTSDTVSGDAAPLGRITLRIIDREDPATSEKGGATVKFALEGAPMQANMWVQLLPASPIECALRLTVKADLNFFLKQMVGKKLQKGVDGLADMLSRLPY